MEDLATLYQGCRTYRRFTQEHIPETILHKIVNVARERSCARNENALRYAVVSRPELVAAMQPMLHWAAALSPEIGTPKIGEQPTALIVMARTEAASPLSDIDIGIAAGAMAVTAWQQGIGSAILASINQPQIKQLLHIPDGIELRLVLALGYPAHKSTVVEPQAGKTLDYYVDDQRNYYVPKLSEKAVITYYA